MEGSKPTYRLDETNGNGSMQHGFIIRAICGTVSDELTVRCCKEHSEKLVAVLNSFDVSLINFKEVVRDWLYSKTVLPIEEQF